jgi:hypothetical protein
VKLVTAEVNASGRATPFYVYLPHTPSEPSA